MFSHWRYLTMATMGRLIAAGLRKWLHRLTWPLTVLDAAGLSLFPVTGASNALDYGLGPAQAIIVGAITGAGAGTVRDVLARRIPVVLQSGPNAISAIIGAGITVAAILGGAHGVAAAVSAATVCFLVRMLGVA
jgi:uncharacterized membrane protein YeiH